LDHYKVGRTAGWAFNNIIRSPGKIGILVGNHRFKNQELNESGFRSYFREHNSSFTLLESQPTYETPAVGREVTEKILIKHPDFCGLFISGGGVRGAISALSDFPTREDFVAIGYELFDETRLALINGILNMIISMPMERFVYESLKVMIKIKTADGNNYAKQVLLDFDIFTPENI